MNIIEYAYVRVDVLMYNYLKLAKPQEIIRFVDP